MRNGDENSAYAIYILSEGMVHAICAIDTGIVPSV